MEASVVAQRGPTPEGVASEDQARAAIYGLIANLFCAAPARGLLATIACAGGEIAGAGSESGLAQSWRELQQAAGVADAVSVRQEYDDSFISAGRAPVFLYGSFYMAGFLMEKPVAKLRDDLARLGFTRREGSGETEDHISALCDVMRLLILGDGETPPAPVAVQEEFFSRHIAPWYAQMTAAVRDAGSTDFYKPVAAFTEHFLNLESQSFEMA